MRPAVRRLTTVAIGLTCVSVLCAVPASASADTPQMIMTSSVYAAFEAGPSGGYSIDIGGIQDLRTGSKGAQARGELTLPNGNIYYLVLGSGSAVDIEVAADLRSAHLRAIVAIQSCTDEDGAPVVDARCPVGQQLPISATFSSSQPLKTFTESNQYATNVLNGRLATASATQDGEDQGTAIYGEITRNVTIVHGG